MPRWEARGGGEGMDARSVAGLILANQTARDSVVIIAMQCGGVLELPDVAGETIVSCRDSIYFLQSHRTH